MTDVGGVRWGWEWGVGRGKRRAYLLVHRQPPCCQRSYQGQCQQPGLLPCASPHCLIWHAAPAPHTMGQPWPARSCLAPLPERTERTVCAPGDVTAISTVRSRGQQGVSPGSTPLPTQQGSSTHGNGLDTGFQGQAFLYCMQAWIQSS